MPIKGLTTQRKASFPQIGILRKGAKKPATGNAPGADLHYFRFVSDDKAAVAAFRAEAGDEPEEVNIRMPFATTNECFAAWKEDWVASSLKHRCDGETCVIWLTKEGKYSQEPIPCPGGCKQVGRLKVVIPSFMRLAYVTVLTTSIWDIVNIHENLLALEDERGDLRGIPLVLRRKYREISTPSGKDGRRARRSKSLITIEAHPEWVKLQLMAQDRAALPSAPEPLLLTGEQEALAEKEDDFEGFTDPGYEAAEEVEVEMVSEPALGATQEEFIEIAKERGISSRDYAPFARRAAIGEITWEKAIAELPK